MDLFAVDRLAVEEQLRDLVERISGTLQSMASISPSTARTISPMVMAEGRLYILDKQGATTVFAAQPKLDVLAKNELGEHANSSIAVSGQQSHFGDRLVTEDDAMHGTSQYAMHKIFNEFQARKYIKTYGMSIVGVRPANVTGPDKVRGSVDHVQIMVDAARGRPVHLPHKGFMRLLIHVEDIAEVFTRVLLAEAPRHHIYNSGGIPVSLGELADIVRGFLPDARITFADDGGREESGNYLVDWSRLAKEFGIEYPGLHTRVLEVINDVRRAEGLPPVAGR